VAPRLRRVPEVLEGADRREAIAHRVAWAAVKSRYRKADGMWVPIDEF